MEFDQIYVRVVLGRRIGARRSDECFLPAGVEVLFVLTLLVLLGYQRWQGPYLVPAGHSVFGRLLRLLALHAGQYQAGCADACNPMWRTCSAKDAAHVGRILAMRFSDVKVLFAPRRATGPLGALMRCC